MKRKQPSKETVAEKTKHDLLVAALLEGCSQAEAAQRSGYSHIWVRQLLMESNDTPGAVALRTALGAAIEEVRERSKWTAQRLIDEHEAQYHLLKVVRPTDAVRHLVEIGKLSGLYVAKHEHSGKFTVADIIGSVSDEELAEAE